MPDISEWFVTAGGNGPIEGCSPAILNDSDRDIKAAVRAYANDAAWFNYGNGTGTPEYTRISGTSFSVTTNVTAAYHAGRRVRAVGSSTGTIHGTIASSAYTSVTTVTVTWDSGSLAAETITVYLYILPVTGAKEARTDVANAFVPAQSFTGDVTMVNLNVTGTLSQDGVPTDPPEFGTAGLANIGTSGATVPLLSTSCTWGSGTTQTFGTVNAVTYKQNGVTLTIGTAAAKDTGTSGANVPLLNGANTWSATQTFATANMTTLQVGGISRNAASTTVAGLMEAATAAETYAGTDEARAVTPDALEGNSSRTLSRGYIKYPGGTLLQYGIGTTTSLGLATITFPLAHGTIVLSIQLTVISNIPNYMGRVKTSSNGSFFVQIFDEGGFAAPPGIQFYWQSVGY